MDEQNDLILQIKEELCSRLLKTSRDIENHRLENVIEQCEQILDMVQQLNDFTDVSPIIELIQMSLMEFEKLLLHDTSSSSLLPHVTTLQGNRGRPQILIPEEILRYYISQCFTSTAIAHFLGISERTVKRKLQMYGITIRDTYAELSDTELNDKVSEIILQFPNIGSKSVIGHLMSRGFRVQQWRVRQALRHVDPAGVLLRRLSLRTINRRKYSVRAPQALWHIDGYHKLIRWRMVIHGGIDGFSRLITFLKISANNRAETVLQAFEIACQKIGLPERVRSDKGGENVLVADYMLRNRGSGSHLAGRSVHNQRIERLWRELWNGCVSLFYSLFCQMEDQQILDPLNENHLIALHYVFLPRIQQHLDQFVAAFIHRPMRTEHGKTPKQLWISGRIEDQLSGNADVVGDLEYYGVDFDGPVPRDLEETVTVPELDHSHEIRETLNQLDPLQESANLGVDVFSQALVLLGN